jgi:hypothetical protein
MQISRPRRNQEVDAENGGVERLALAACLCGKVAHHFGVIWLREMRQLRTFNLAAGAALLAWCCCATGILAQGVPNLAEVEPGVWRGGQPTEAGWTHLKSLGITNVIKLNLQSEGSDAAAQHLGMKVYPVPIPLPEQLGLKPIDTNDIEKILTAVPAAGTFIHCEHGQDQTGLFVALWRVRRDGWSKSDAEKEMLAHGFHKDLRGLWQFWNSANAAATPKTVR